MKVETRHARITTIRTGSNEVMVFAVPYNDSEEYLIITDTWYNDVEREDYAYVQPHGDAMGELRDLDNIMLQYVVYGGRVEQYDDVVKVVEGERVTIYYFTRTDKVYAIVDGEVEDLYTLSDAEGNTRDLAHRYNNDVVEEVVRLVRHLATVPLKA